MDEAGVGPHTSFLLHKEFEQTLEQSPHMPPIAKSPAQDNDMNKVGGGRVC